MDGLDKADSHIRMVDTLVQPICVRWAQSQSSSSWGYDLFQMMYGYVTYSKGMSSTLQKRRESMSYLLTLITSKFVDYCIWVFMLDDLDFSIVEHCLLYL